MLVDKKLMILINFKPWMIWTILGICLLSLCVGLAFMFIAIFDHSITDDLFKKVGLIAALPWLFLVAWVQGRGLFGGEKHVVLASRKARILIWCLVGLMVCGAALVVVWVLGLEKQ